ncbi:unnamed protein product [Symbiodinium sp. CCMP2592]|nr:unnamed protein product [Symbiodinium sp. CCMP2592]
MAPKKRKADESNQSVRDVLSCARGVSQKEAARVIKKDKHETAPAHKDANRYPETYPLLSSIAVREAGTDHILQLPVLRLDKALQARCQKLPGLADVLGHHMRKEAVEGLDGILYVDEAVPGNVLRPDQNRKGYLAHFSWTALGLGLARGSSWITVGFVRHKTIDQISGGLASYMQALALFLEECVVGVPLEDSCRVPFLLRARKIYLLGDEAALKATAGSKGASGMRPCLKCQNAVSKQHRRAVSLVCIDEPDISKFLPMRQEKLDAIMQHLRAASSISEYEKDCKLLGWYLIPRSLSSCPGTLVNVIDSVYDPMHCLWSNGIVNVEIGLFLERAAAQGLQKTMLQSLAALAWKCGTKGSAKEVLDERILVFGADYKGGATQCALALPLLTYFAETVLGDCKSLAQEVKSLRLLCLVCCKVFSLKTPGRSLQETSGLQSLQCQHLAQFKATYTSKYVKPKHHYSLHIPQQVAIMGLAVDCWSTERKNKNFKQAAPRFPVPAKMEKGVLLLLNEDEQKDSSDTYSKRPKLNMPMVRRPHVGRILGTDNFLASESLLMEGGILHAGTYILSAAKAVNVECFVQRHDDPPSALGCELKRENDRLPFREHTFTVWRPSKQCVLLAPEQLLQGTMASWMLPSSTGDKVTLLH